MIEAKQGPTRVVLENIPFRLYKAIRIFMAQNDIKRIDTAVYRILDSDVVLQHIILQFRENAKAEEIKRVSREQVMKEITNQGGNNVR